MIKFFKRLIKPRWLYLLSSSLNPISENYGRDRGRSIDRYYIEKFLFQNRKYIKGNCLEVRENVYTTKFGQDVKKSDVIDINPRNKKANIIGDLRRLDLPDNSYDCIILTQVLQYIDDCPAAVAECHRILKPKGVILVTLPFLGKVDPTATARKDYWRFTKASAEYLFKNIYSKVETKTYGNVLSGLGFWIGLSRNDLNRDKLKYNDPNFPTIITVKATK